MVFICISSWAQTAEFMVNYSEYQEPSADSKAGANLPEVKLPEFERSEAAESESNSAGTYQLQLQSAPPKEESRTEALVLPPELCKTCLAQNIPVEKIPIPTPRPEYDPSTQQLSAGAQREVNYKRFRDGKKMNLQCRSIIDQDYVPGSTGELLLNYMRQQPYASTFFNSSSGLREFCPKFGNLSRVNQERAWLWFWAVLANEESGCNPNKYHPTHVKKRNGKLIRINNKEGWGLFAAELHPGDRNWRGRMCRGNIKTVSLQVSCAVHTMHDMQLTRGRGAQYSSSYWGPVRRSSKQIGPNMKGFSPCF